MNERHIIFLFATVLKMKSSHGVQKRTVQEQHFRKHARTLDRPRNGNQSINQYTFPGYFHRPTAVAESEMSSSLRKKKLSGSGVAGNLELATPFSGM